jgi:hypothetical protein
MTKQVTEILRKLRSVRFEPGYLETLEDLANELRECEDAQSAVEPVLRFIEAHPDQDLGAPGPLVHFVEQYYGKGYENLLLASVRRKATLLNVWMLNRILNDSGATQRTRYVNAMREIASSARTAPDVRALAREFLSHAGL